MGEPGAPLRVYLTGRVRVEAAGVLVDEGDLPGRQGRLLLALLAAERDRPLQPDAMADVVWGQGLPAAWDNGLRALVSKLRRALGAVGLPADAVLHSFGCYQLRLPAGTWVDTEAAVEAVHAAEVELAGGRPEQAYGWTYVGYHITRRPFLSGEDGPWATAYRSRLHGLHLRSLDCVVECAAATGDLAESVRAAEDALALDPLREATYQRYMRVLAAAGNRAESLRVWERCRRALGEELGVAPSAQTEAVYLEVLRS